MSLQDATVSSNAEFLYYPANTVYSYTFGTNEFNWPVEPSFAWGKNGNVIVVSNQGNRYSSNYGVTWNTMNPRPAGDGFTAGDNWCCDQDVIYDPPRDQFLMYSQADLSFQLIQWDGPNVGTSIYAVRIHKYGPRLQ